MEALQARVRASERAQAELEQTASRQMEGLAQQSTVALEALHRRLGLAHTQLEQLQAFTKVLDWITGHGLEGRGQMYWARHSTAQGSVVTVKDMEIPGSCSVGHTTDLK